PVGLAEPAPDLLDAEGGPFGEDGEGLVLEAAGEGDAVGEGRGGARCGGGHLVEQHEGVGSDDAMVAGLEEHGPHGSDPAEADGGDVVPGGGELAEVVEEGEAVEDGPAGAVEHDRDRRGRVEAVPGGQGLEAAGDAVAV